MKILIGGATGLVGSTMLKVLEEYPWARTVENIIPVASERSRGRLIEFRGEALEVITMEEALDQKPDAALFSAGSAFSIEWAPRLAKMGIPVVDNSSAWRMDPSVPLIIPEINPHHLKTHHRIVANPNCSTIQMLMALKPLHDAYGLEEVVVSTYQAVTGTGYKAVRQLMSERAGNPPSEMAYAYTIDLNLIPQVDVFLDNGFTREEMKMRNETRKIMDLPELRVAATCVRVPVMGGHSESVCAHFQHFPNVEECRDLLRRMPGVVILDNPLEGLYPMPIQASGRNEVFVGRLRQDLDNPYRLHMWVVSDNLRKGAAWNAVQILQLLAARGILS
ncbi:MAG: aspartate-semialdehyde dehydrogenase [Flavobacteriales bacterium]|nr:aspartate-semialdehyde dehydrogenase [Flavobacteriales bacterium]